MPTQASNDLEFNHTFERDKIICFQRITWKWHTFIFRTAQFDARVLCLCGEVSVVEERNIDLKPMVIRMC